MSKCRIMRDTETLYHMVRENNGWSIYRASQFEGEGYTGVPILSGDEEDCRNWFHCHGITDFGVVRRVCLVPPQFLDDLVRVADDVRHTLDGLLDTIGWRVHSDCFLRYTSRRCYNGDLGGSARLVKAFEKPDNPVTLERATNDLVYLCGMSRAAYELGFTLSYDEEGRHKLTGFPRYVIDMEG